MERETVLEIEFTPVWDKWAWRITKQDEGIFERGEFKDRELNVKSVYRPQHDTTENSLFIRGEFKENDDDLNFCTHEEKALIEEKVRLINLKYGKVKLQRLEVQEDYFYICEFGEVYETFENNVCTDEMLFELKNYFPTRELAQECLEKYIKPAFEKFWKDREKRGE